MLIIYVEYFENVLYSITFMTQWLKRVFQGHEVIVHDLQVNDSNPGLVKFRVFRTSVYIVLEPKIFVDASDSFDMQPVC